jgi:hypothetical protein
MHGGVGLTPLRAWAHDLPRYYVQNFGNPVSHPDSNDYAAFGQDTVRLTKRLEAVKKSTEGLHSSIAESTNVRTLQV